jgi:hypothetical protein
MSACAQQHIRGHTVIHMRGVMVHERASILVSRVAHIHYLSQGRYVRSSVLDTHRELANARTSPEGIQRSGGRCCAADVAYGARRHTTHMLFKEACSADECLRGSLLQRRKRQRPAHQHHALAARQLHNRGRAAPQRQLGAWGLVNICCRRGSRGRGECTARSQRGRRNAVRMCF